VAAEQVAEEQRRRLASASSAAAELAPRGPESPAGEPAAREALQSVRIGDAPSAPAAPRSLGSAESAAASAPGAAFRSLAEVGDLTGRHAVPESSIGGETTCIVCFVNPKTHLAAPCGHQCACGPCSKLMQVCPYCRAPVQLWVQHRLV
jgi:hypothetical protein